jgi:hypothetical protein
LVRVEESPQGFDAGEAFKNRCEGTQEGCEEKHRNHASHLEIYGRHEETRTPDLYRVKVAL